MQLRLRIESELWLTKSWIQFERHKESRAEVGWRLIRIRPWNSSRPKESGWWDVTAWLLGLSNIGYDACLHLVVSVRPRAMPAATSTTPSSWTLPAPCRKRASATLLLSRHATKIGRIETGGEGDAGDGCVAVDRTYLDRKGGGDAGEFRQEFRKRVMRDSSLLTRARSGPVRSSGLVVSSQRRAARCERPRHRTRPRRTRWDLLRVLTSSRRSLRLRWCSKVDLGGSGLHAYRNAGRRVGSSRCSRSCRRRSRYNHSPCETLEAIENCGSLVIVVTAPSLSRVSDAAGHRWIAIVRHDYLRKSWRFWR